MSTSNSPFAFGPPPVGAGAAYPKQGPDRMFYWRSWHFIFENPNWFTNVLMGIVCQLIPVVGPLVFMGYQFEIVESLHLRRHPTYPDFDFNRFAEYLKRGLWPFLVALVVSLIILPLLYGIIIGLFVLTAMLASAAGEDAAGIVFLCGLPVVFLVFFLAIALFNLILQPMMLAAGLTQDFGQAFRFAWLRDFIGRVGKQLIGSALFLMMVSMIGVTVGMITCGIGMYPVMVILLLAQAHLQFQLYQLYLQRGGEPLMLKFGP